MLFLSCFSQAFPENPRPCGSKEEEPSESSIKYYKFLPPALEEFQEDNETEDFERRMDIKKVYEVNHKVQFHRFYFHIYVQTFRTAIIKFKFVLM